MKRTATAHWAGTGKDGSGHLTTDSKTLNATPYSYLSRFESGAGTNPEELIAAAHAGCFTMKLTFLLSSAGFTATTLDTQCAITLENGKVTSSQLQLVAQVAGISQDKFEELANEAKLNCPISQLLNTTINLSYTLS